MAATRTARPARLLAGAACRAGGRHGRPGRALCRLSTPAPAVSMVVMAGDRIWCCATSGSRTRCAPEDGGTQIYTRFQKRAAQINLSLHTTLQTGPVRLLCPAQAQRASGSAGCRAPARRRCCLSRRRSRARRTASPRTASSASCSGRRCWPTRRPAGRSCAAASTCCSARRRCAPRRAAAAPACPAPGAKRPRRAVLGRRTARTR